MVTFLSVWFALRATRAGKARTHKTTDDEGGRMFRRLTTLGTALLLGISTLLAGGAPAQAAAPAYDPDVSSASFAPAVGGETDVIAHRGASAYAPENTLAAVRKAHALGAVWVENDVQRTKDGRLVIIHDTTLRRTTDVEERYPDRAPWNVGDFTLAEIRELDAGGWFDPAYTGERVPTLESYLRLLHRTGQRLLLEIKAPELYPGIEKDTLHVLREEGWMTSEHLRSSLVVQAFSADCVATVHSLAPEVRTGFLGTPREERLEEYARFVDQINPPYRDITPRYVDAVHKVTGPHGARLEVLTWTVNDAEIARWVADAGVDGIITDTPDTVRDALD